MKIGRFMGPTLALILAAAGPLASRAALVERAVPAIPSAPAASLSAGAVGAALAPQSAAPLAAASAFSPAPLAPSLKIDAAAVAAAALPAASIPAAPAGAGAAAAPAPAPADDAALAQRKRQIALRYAQQILDGLTSRAADRSGELDARALPAGRVAELGRAILQKDDALRPLRATAASAAGNEAMIGQVLRELAAPRGLESALYSLAEGLRRAYEGPLPSGPRAEVSRVLHSTSREFLARVAAEDDLPESVRGVAAKASGYFEDDRMLAAVAWERQEKTRIAEGRAALLAERIEDRSGKVQGRSAFNASGGWHPPASAAAVPLRAGESVAKWTTSMNEVSKRIREARALFELARARRDAAKRLRLSRAGREREALRWKKAASDYARALDRQEDVVSRIMNNSVTRSFSSIDVRGRPLRVPDHPGLSFREVEGGYRVEARFVTSIDDPAVIDAFRRSIESYWSGRFQEDGRERTFETRVSVRVLAAGEPAPSDALRLIESGRTNSFAGGDQIALARTFEFHTPAHEFGHVLGLPDEYVSEYAPEAMAVRHEQDGTSLMASPGGLVLDRHFAEAARLLKLAAAGPSISAAR
ncbi:MAG TPA: hypothetical protein VN915_16265 [Elusimicrobiota bacterium]|nr:hypothetical protein [Elusimicrobiota bacterium]